VHEGLGRAGGVEGFNAYTAFLPDDGVGLVVLTNITVSPVARVVPLTIMDRMLGLEPIAWNARIKRAHRREKAAKRPRRSSPKRGKHPTHALRDFAGTYRNAGYGEWTVSLQRGKLTVTSGDNTFSLVHRHYNVFDFDAWPATPSGVATFHLDKDGHVASVSVNLQTAVADVVFKRMAMSVEQGVGGKT